eukprot:gene10003-biopygen2921
MLYNKENTTRLDDLQSLELRFADRHTQTMVGYGGGGLEQWGVPGASLAILWNEARPATRMLAAKLPYEVGKLLVVIRFGVFGRVTRGFGKYWRTGEYGTSDWEVCAVAEEPPLVVGLGGL